MENQKPGGYRGEGRMLEAEARSEEEAKLEVHTTRNNIELELIQTQMAQKPMLRAEVGRRVRCANKASAE